jgi:hypothetical protein
MSAAAARNDASRERAPRSVPAEYPPNGAWPSELRAPMAASYLNFADTGSLFRAMLRGEAPKPTSSRIRKNGGREPLWARKGLDLYVARRHQIPDDGSPDVENIAGLI